MPHQSENIRLLIVDKNVTNIQAYEESLEKFSKKVSLISTTCEESAFKYLDKNPPPDAIIFDLDSLLKRPIFFISEIKRRESLDTIPLVVIGDGSEADNLYLCLGVGVNQFIKRPSNVREFSFFISRMEYLVKNPGVFPDFRI